MSNPENQTEPLKSYMIIDDSGVDYAFLRDNRSWVGQVVKGNPCPSLYHYRGKKTFWIDWMLCNFCFKSKRNL